VRAGPHSERSAVRSRAARAPQSASDARLILTVLVSSKQSAAHLDSLVRRAGNNLLAVGAPCRTVDGAQVDLQLLRSSESTQVEHTKSQTALGRRWHRSGLNATCSHLLLHTGSFTLAPSHLLLTRVATCCLLCANCGDLVRGVAEAGGVASAAARHYGRAEES
jgi:hypothetical protein